MSKGSNNCDTSPEQKRNKLNDLLQKSYKKGDIAFRHAIGLGATENVIPVSQPLTSGPPRPVEVGWHPVGGLAGKWFAEKTGLGKLITDKINEYPDPTQHWAMLVGEYAHQLWMDENFDVIYTNARIKREEWRTFPVGETCFNDDALRRTGEAVIQQIRSTRPGYNLISNNCQTYVLQLLDAVRVSQVKEFATTLAVYDRLFGAGKVSDLFVDDEEGSAAPHLQPGSPAVVVAPIEGQQTGVIGATADQSHMLYHHPEALLQQGGQDTSSGPTQQNSIVFAQQVMNANTTQLNSHDEMHRGVPESTERGFDEQPSLKAKERSWGKKTSEILGRFKR
ncbi:hypothetical protein HBH56_023040 [Parastagonospora nodorum]|uniref:Uncharacterized protein n=2 Tax=Phaeosphaeria nodorum (strain SN15 / ATCC MYA-4574 / FGSC 10173) TaxID=321614 RepID=Q0UQ62_PHANO|nr:hypothetical protein SNOG_06102 [Parastagonospora nodorum SN15]KAH3918693.1 hypothetical protein HBH56_023040 [Parastagonospora nodorum]EAT85933.1 hypothetical protein SNOG_06102 [Parastagonospora nodorum SN15]KAH3934090.1 hypothetical protein HBH54_059010 [Parastagonospora nodorum]KAH4141652.1 hypothetical protein HBH45_057780 [Parastagonospora nodorum]KAH4161417.1 hypothetical protein HBH44_091380 [Parastagonospora nodorum]